MDSLRFDESYVNRLKARDPQTESHFAAYFSDLLLLKLRRSVRSPQLASDVRQETLLRVLRAVRQNGLVSPDRLGAFVCAVCNNVLKEQFRSADRFQGDAEATDPIDYRVMLDQELVNEERKRAVAAVLAQLSEKDRSLLRMLFLEEKDKDEVCRRFHVTPEYLRVVLHRAKTRFRDKYLETTGDSGEVKRLRPEIHDKDSDPK